MNKNFEIPKLDKTAAICARTRKFSYNINNFVDSCLDSFFNTVGKQIDCNCILSLYIPFIFHKGDRSSYLMRYSLIDINKPNIEKE